MSYLGLNVKQQADYFEIWLRRKPTAAPYHLCTVRAQSRDSAVRLARSTFNKLPRSVTAKRIGKEGYFRNLKQAFPTTS